MPSALIMGRREDISEETQTSSCYLFLPESLKPLAKGFLSIFNLVIYKGRKRELVELSKFFFFQQMKITDGYHSYPNHLYDDLSYLFPQTCITVTLPLSMNWLSAWQMNSARGRNPAALGNLAQRWGWEAVPKAEAQLGPKRKTLGAVTHQWSCGSGSRHTAQVWLVSALSQPQN